MSGGPATDILQLKEEDVVKFLLSGTHLGSNNVDFQMQPYIYKKKPDGIAHYYCTCFIIIFITYLCLYQVDNRRT